MLKINDLCKDRNKSAHAIHVEKRLKRSNQILY